MACMQDIPLAAAQELMVRYDGVNSGAWQAAGATLALVGNEATFADYTFNELQTLFRSSSILTANA